MEWATSFIAEIYLYLNHRDDTGIDRLNRLYTVALLSACVTLISSQQYVVEGRIHCWTLKDFSDAQIKYAHDICWLGHTNYYVSENLTELNSPSLVRAYPFAFYPWLPVILICMTVCFAAPYLLIWRGLSTRSGIDVRRLMKLDNREELNRAMHAIFFKTYSMRNKSRFYLTSIYLITKISYIINLFCQIGFLSHLLVGNVFPYNIVQILKVLSVKYNMWSSAFLPIETMCDFMVRMLGGNNNWYTVQCILPFNLFTKRIVALLILWYIILLILNIIDFAYVWLWQRIWSKANRYDYIRNLFHLYETCLHSPHDNERMILSDVSNEIYRKEFIYKYLGLDGYVLLKFLNTNSSDMHMSYVVVNLFRHFIDARTTYLKEMKKENTNDIVL